MNERELLWLQAASHIRPELVRLVGAARAGELERRLDELLAASAEGEEVANRIKVLLLSDPETTAWIAHHIFGGTPTREERWGRTPRAEESTGGSVVVTVYYGTDRAPSGRPEPARYFGADRGALTLGTADVSIPRDHRMGALESPSLWRLEFRPDPAKHVTLVGLRVHDRETFAALAGARVADSPNRDALLFVHGYNVTFEDAARRAAQIAYDLGFGGAPLLYSWPSEGATLRYTVDETNVRWTVSHFTEFFRLALTGLGARKVHVIAHSMGNRALVEALRTFDVTDLGDGAASIDQVIFAAPDIDTETFVDLAREFHRRATRYTLYASSADKALAASKALHGYPRAGDSGPGLVVTEYVDTVDATLVDTSLMGHSYIGQNNSILADVFDLLRDGSPPDQRFRLAPRTRVGRRYWYFKA
jgi:esterase/lipase superfamily enzyme